MVIDASWDGCQGFEKGFFDGAGGHAHMMKRIFRLRFGKYFAEGKDAAPSSASKAGRTVLALLMVAMLMISEAREGRTDQARSEAWREHVRQLRAKGEDVKVMKSKNMTPEKSPEAFLKKYKKVKEKAGENFTFQTFVEDVARGLVIEQRYEEINGVLYVKKENRNPNYRWVSGERSQTGIRHLSLDYDKFCITPELLRDVFGKEDRIVTYKDSQRKYYEYYSMGMGFSVYFTAGMNENCAKEIDFDSNFYRRMEKR